MQGIGRLYQQGLSDRKIAKRLGCSYGKVTYWRRKNNKPPNNAGPNTHTPKERFDDKWTERRCYDDLDTPCWVWTAGKMRTGYGSFRMNGKTHLSHRVSWQLYRGEDPGDAHVLHKNVEDGSHRRDCVNPEHLYLGTRSDNMRDSVKANGAPNGRGEDVPTSKLTEDDVRGIKQMIANNHPYNVIIQRFDISKPSLCDIKYGRTWTHVEWPTLIIDPKWY